MTLFLLIGLALVGLSMWLLLTAVGMRRARVVETLSGMSRYGFEKVPPSHERSPRGLRAGLDRLADSLGTFAGRYFGSEREAALRQELRSAALYDVTPRKFLGYRLLAAIALPALWLWLGSAGGYPGAMLVLGVAFGALLGWQGPLVLVRRRGRMRLDAIDYQMPGLIDLLVTTIEAGVGFSGSLQLAAERMHGELGEELRLALQEQDMGLSTEAALSNMLERADTPALRTFVRAILQGEQLGVSIGKIMRDLATEMRKIRRQKAEERAQKAPTKMLFPLAFLIFPSIFVVLLGPAVIEIMRSFKGL